MVIIILVTVPSPNPLLTLTLVSSVILSECSLESKHIVFLSPFFFFFPSFLLFFFFCFLGLHLWLMEVPRLGVELELEPQQSGI